MPIVYFTINMVSTVCIILAPPMVNHWLTVHTAQNTIVVKGQNEEMNEHFKQDLSLFLPCSTLSPLHHICLKSVPYMNHRHWKAKNMANLQQVSFQVTCLFYTSLIIQGDSWLFRGHIVSAVAWNQEDSCFSEISDNSAMPHTQQGRRSLTYSHFQH